MDPSKIDWGDGFGGFVTGILSSMLALFGWFGKKIREVHKRVDVVESSIGAFAVHVGRQQEQHEANQYRLNRIDDNLESIADKVDRQTELLMRINQK